MLVLTRKTNQSIMIGDEIEVSVLAVSRDKIRLGITAPRDVPVFRKEVYVTIKGEAGQSEDEPEAVAPSSSRRIQRTEQRGNVGFGALLLALTATVVVVTLVMFETLAWLMG